MRNLILNYKIINKHEIMQIRIILKRLKKI
jgi:hypothetical protein